MNKRILNITSRMRQVALYIFVAASMMLAATTTGNAADAASHADRPAIYDTKADGQKQVAEALAKAKADHKMVLLQFGANWCPWCHKLHALFESDPKIAAKLKESFVVVLVDVDKSHNAEVVKRFENPTRFGLPVIVVLDAEGKLLATQDTGKLEDGDHHSPEKVLAFLNSFK